MSDNHTNRLIHETSPYLLQHAHNPVDWYPWSEEALAKAKELDKPILVSIGYSACHWCHVMERESFENEETAHLMNEHFINIKIDREERPDLDHIYMDAVQAITGSGGWPLNVFLTPEGKPFYGGTYFPPVKAFNRASWKEILNGVSLAFKEKRQEIDAQAENLTDHLLESNSFGSPPGENLVFPTPGSAELMTHNILKTADTVWGGFGNAPKFPQTFTIKFLLRNSIAQTPTAKQGLVQALLSLDKMIEGGIYDQLGGGFARYSTDTEWLAPHFEKMLYDNALLIDVLSEAYQLTRDEKYQRVIDESMVFIQRELLHEKGGFYAALDADSEGVEGKFYVWELDEIKELLGDDAEIFAKWFDINGIGSWEGKNILRTLKTAREFVKDENIFIEKLNDIIARGKKILLEERDKRIRPQLDDKIILGWNALMNAACSKAFAATGKNEYKALAIRNMDFLLAAFVSPDGKTFHHTWKNKQAKYPAFLDDYSFLIRALLHLQEITAETKWLDKAAGICQHVIDHFREDETGLFFYTGKEQTDVIVRKKEVYDGAVPSGNSVMALNLYRLSILLDRPEWQQRAIDMLKGLEKAIIKYPGSFGNWASLLLEISGGTNEIAIVGTNYGAILENLLKEYIPHRVIMASEKPVIGYPLLDGKKSYERAAVFLCRNYSCLRPVFSVKDLMSLINNPENR